MLCKHNTEVDIVEGEIVGCDEGEDIRPILICAVTRGLADGVEFEGDQVFDIRCCERRSAIF